MVGETAELRMHHGLIIASRVAVGVIGALAFYFAFFLYEDEEGRWQNRIENLWIAVYDRARSTDSNTTALFTKVAELLKNAADRLFGRRFFSAQAICVSAALSLGMGTLVAALLDRFVFGSAAYSHTTIFGHLIVGRLLNDSWSLLGELPGTFYVVYEHVFPQPQFAFAIAFSIIFITCGLMAAIAPKLWAIRLSYAPLLIFGVRLIVMELVAIKLNSTDEVFFPLMLVVLLCSIWLDYLSIVVLRKVFGTISKSISVLKILSLIVVYVIATIVAALAPAIFLMVSTDLLDGFWTFSQYCDPLSLLLMCMNMTTLIYCATPIFCLGVILLHKLVWPFLSRIAYPVVRHRLIGNRKVLVPVGVLCLTFAFNLEHVGAKELLKLLS